MATVFYRKDDYGEWPHSFFVRTDMGRVYVGRGKRVGRQWFEFEMREGVEWLSSFRTTFNSLKEIKDYIFERFSAYKADTGDTSYQDQFYREQAEKQTRQQRRREERAYQRQQRRQENYERDRREWEEAFRRWSRERAYSGGYTNGARARTAEPPPPSDEDDFPPRVKQILIALRAKTTDRGCTVAEAAAAQAKVSELRSKYLGASA